jgi:hypothetical protein
MSIITKHCSIIQKQLNRSNNNVNLDERIISGHKREFKRLDPKRNKPRFSHIPNRLDGHLYASPFNRNPLKKVKLNPHLELQKPLMLTNKNNGHKGRRHLRRGSNRTSKLPGLSSTWILHGDWML